MEGGKSLINLGDLGKPATVLIEKISDAIGGYCRPWQIRRVAKAEAEAERIKALSQIETQIETAELTQRALGRFLAEETKKQYNMESITSKALPELDDNAKPEEIEDDWITNFFDKCRLISDDEMQELWAKILAGEANSPGKYSKRTVNFLGSIDKTDAINFTRLCGFACLMGINNIVPIIYELDESLYKEHNITFDILRHLDDIGLLRFEPSDLQSFLKTSLPKRIRLFYYGTPINIEFAQEENNSLKIGKVLLSRTGQEIAQICDSKAIHGFLDYLIKRWIDQRLILSSPFPQTPTPNPA